MPMLAAVAALLLGAALVEWQKRQLVAALESTIDEERENAERLRERITQLEHTLDEARTQALNLTPPVLRDAALRDTPAATAGYEAELLTELNAIEDDGHKQEYIETISQMRRERPDITDREIRLTLFP